MDSKGLSTVLAPIHVSTSVTEHNDHMAYFLKRENFEDFPFFSKVVLKTKIERSKATTPPSFEGIDRRIT